MGLFFKLLGIIFIILSTTFAFYKICIFVMGESHAFRLILILILGYIFSILGNILDKDRS